MTKPVTPLLTVDCVIVDRLGRVLLIKRANAPFKGQYALPGGFVDLDETVENACLREVLEETQVKIRRPQLVGIYSEPGRDPRGATVSIAYAARVSSTKAEAGDDAAAAEWVSDWQRQTLAFDHADIVRDAVRLLARTRVTRKRVARTKPTTVAKHTRAATRITTRARR
jgi:8-oxo-dGTP diphosphatase